MFLPALVCVSVCLSVCVSVCLSSCAESNSVRFVHSPVAIGTVTYLQLA